jgi:hypothetical protein
MYYRMIITGTRMRRLLLMMRGMRMGMRGGLWRRGGGRVNGGDRCGLRGRRGEVWDAFALERKI